MNWVDVIILLAVVAAGVHGLLLGGAVQALSFGGLAVGLSPEERWLPLRPGGVPRGTTGAVLGYPGNGPFDAEPAVVLTRLDAVGRNIYGQGLVTRAVYEIQSLVRPGNSGGPLVRADGTVAGGRVLPPGAQRRHRLHPHLRRGGSRARHGSDSARAGQHGPCAAG